MKTAVVEKVSTQEVNACSQQLATIVDEAAKARRTDHALIYGIPRGGLTVAYAIAAALKRVKALVWSASETGDPPLTTPLIVLVDDLVVSGATMSRFSQIFSPHLRLALFSKHSGGYLDLIGFHAARALQPDVWYEFPWEANDSDKGRPEDAVRRLIEYLGDDPNRPGVKDTPKRVLKYLDELREGASADFTTTAFESQIDDLIIVSEIGFYSLCEHHMLPYFGTADVGYIPTGQILGLSKLARIVAAESSKLTIQEELSHAIAARVKEAAGCESVAVVTRATHTCMAMRGAKANGAVAIASAMLGEFRENSTLRYEFLMLDRRAQ